jgi:hypothetical protein
MASVLQGFKDLGIEIANGIIKVAQIVVKTLVVEKNTDQTQSSIGEGVIKAEETSVTIESNQVMSTSKIFVTFRSDYGSRWWVSYQEKGRFIVNIADPLSEDVKFDWWIVQTEQVEITQTADTTTPIEEPIASSSSPVDLPAEVPVGTEEGTPSETTETTTTETITETETPSTPTETTTQTDTIPTSIEDGVETPTDSVGAEPTTTP